MVSLAQCNSPVCKGSQKKAAAPQLLRGGSLRQHAAETTARTSVIPIRSPLSAFTQQPASLLHPHTHTASCETEQNAKQAVQSSTAAMDQEGEQRSLLKDTTFTEIGGVLRQRLPPTSTEEIMTKVFGTKNAPTQRVSESLDYEPVQNTIFYKRMKAAKEKKHLFG